MLTLALAYAGRAGRSLDSGISEICACLSGGVGSGQKGMGMKQDDADEVFPVSVVELISFIAREANQQRVYAQGVQAGYTNEERRTVKT